jgi:hypothetical protein
MRGPFHEARESLTTVKREFTDASSLNAATMFIANLACEAAVATLWVEATGSDFQYQSYPRHKPGRWVEIFGIDCHYTPYTRRFLKTLDSYAPDKIRYETTQAFREHTKVSASGRGQEVVRGVERFIDETERLLFIPEVVNLLRTSPRRSGA